MDTAVVDSDVDSWVQVCLTKTLGLFHGALVIVIIFLIILGHEQLS